MSEPFIGEIVMFAGNFAPRNWAFCDGQLLAIAQNTALFSILGTTYGGDGRTTFGLPDLRGRVAIHPGNGPGLSPYQLGQRGGTEQVLLTVNDIPAHAHALQNGTAGVKTSITARSDAANQTAPAGNLFASGNLYSDQTPANAIMGGGAASSVISGNTNPAGGNLPHTNIQPYQCVNFIIALFGIFPSRN